MKKKWRITYNAPVTLTFALVCAGVLLLNDFLLGKNLIPALFTAPGSAKSLTPFNWQSPLDYVRLIMHVFGHSDWNHLIGNLSFILLLGPLMEERYGSPAVALMMTVTALVTGVLNACVIPSSLLGASGIAFMLIILSSLSTIEKNVIPVSFLLVLAIYMTREFLNATKLENIATFAHIAGGLCGSLFGFMVAPKKKAAGKPKVADDDEKSDSCASSSVRASSTSRTAGSAYGQEAERERAVAREPLQRVAPLRKASSSERDSTLVGTISL